MKNTGKEFESLTEQVFAGLLKEDGICASLQRDVVIQGIATDHQIDVTFEFRAGSMLHRAIVQCKDWATKVKQEQVLAFHAVLADIPGQPRGIIVSRTGFQKGARNFAERHGIKLYELRATREEDWNGLVQKVVTDAHVRIPSFDEVRLVYDEDAVKAEMRTRGLTQVEFSYSGSAHDIPLTFESGRKCDLSDVFNGIMRDTGYVAGPVHHEFSEPLFAEYPGCPIPRLPVKAVTGVISFSSMNRRIEVDLGRVTPYCFRDVLNGTSRFLASNGAPLGTKPG